MRASLLSNEMIFVFRYNGGTQGVCELGFLQTFGEYFHPNPNQNSMIFHAILREI